MKQGFLVYKLKHDLIIFIVDEDVICMSQKLDELLFIYQIKDYYFQ
jgi:hypothetical protein